MASYEKGQSLRTRNDTPQVTLFSVKVRLQETGEMFRVPCCSRLTKVAELIERLELVAGIPAHFQRLSYIDEGDMPDKSTFKYNGIIPKGTISLRTWSQDGCSDLVKAAAEGDLTKLKCLGVTVDSNYNTPNSLLLSLEARCDWVAARASTALYIASHRGHTSMVHFLLRNGANVHGKTSLGNSPLHVAAAMGNCDCIDELLAYGAEIQDTDGNGHSALDLAALWGQKSVENRLFLYQWRKRASKVSLKSHLDPKELFPHQKFDSSLQTWRRGPQAKNYMVNLVNHGEYSGSNINAPRKHSSVRRQANLKESNVNMKPSIDKPG
ncbi:ankyrin repeat domain-containing protein 60 [Xenopus laevis]|nr:ankyrin repeat domain-containing protein 60 [Xenopus laevis]